MDCRGFKRLCLVLIALEFTIAQSSNQLSYEIKSLFGQPDYRSVNLTWEVEDKLEKHLPSDGAPKKFIVNYCELQSWGEMHRCRMKLLEDHKKNSSKAYHLMIKNLRMATKYSFKVRPQTPGDSEKLARSEKFSTEVANEQSIVVPTKGFSAIATKCLPNESEIMIETGPFFGGRIASENGNCGIEGNSKDSRETYTMRIDHEKCGSQVSHDDLTVETYITVQENSGLLTHSTRRFLVVCTFQPDTLTVRARLALPGKGGASVVDDSWTERDRGARERQFKMVDKSALILKESGEHSSENAVGDIESLTEKILADEKSEIASNAISRQRQAEPLKNARYSRFSSDFERSSDSSTLRFDSIIGITVGVALTVLIIFIFFYIFKKRRDDSEHMKLQNTAVF